MGKYRRDMWQAIFWCMLNICLGGYGLYYVGGLAAYCSSISWFAAGVMAALAVHYYLKPDSTSDASVERIYSNRVWPD